jgi:uncharacterized Ntn-hydrolase superfamily protein
MTYSILGWDADTGEMGGAIQSHFFGVGPLSLWMEPGIGVVATQMIRDPSHGPRALACLDGGLDPEATIEGLLQGDPAAAVRQVAILDVRGRTATYTGAACIPAAGGVSAHGCAAQGAMLSATDSWVEMATAFENSPGPLANRLLAALDAGEKSGGDLRGQRAAALRVVAVSATGNTALDRSVDLRIDDSPIALEELRRLYAQHLRQVEADHAFDLGTSGRLADGLDAFERSQARASADPDIAFRHALLLAMDGRGPEARERLAFCYARGEGWRELVRRLPAAGFLPRDEALMSLLLA